VEYYQRYFQGIKTKVIDIPGRTFPVKSLFLKAPLNLEQDEFLQRAQTIIEEIINQEQAPGDILVFLPAISQIEQSCREINQQLQKKLKEPVICLTLYRGLTQEQKELVQDATKYRSLANHPQRKIVFSTNIAESGVTIDGVKFVIDSGLAMNMSFDAAKRMKVLKKEYISQFEVEQRKGRAGRTAPGTCFHLYTESEYQNFKQSKPSDLSTINLDYLIMDLLNTTLIKTKNNILQFFSELIEPPSEAQLNSTFRYLQELKIIDPDTGTLTPRGQCLHHMNMSEVGIGLAILASAHFDTTKSVIRVAAMLETESNISKWFRAPTNPTEASKFKKLLKRYQGSFSDLQIFLKLYQEFLAAKDRHQWAQNRFLKLHMFHKAQRTEKELNQKYAQIPQSCQIQSTITPSKDLHKNVVLSFLHGFYNQILTRQDHPNTYLNQNQIEVPIQAGRYNTLSQLKPNLVYMELIKVMERIQVTGLINISGDLEVLLQIAES
jgi:HrpA-like RNA helicase